MDIVLILILMFYFSALTGFFLSCASFSVGTKLRANLWILGMVFGMFVLSWIGFAI